jgi:hypothetical protein
VGREVSGYAAEVSDALISRYDLEADALDLRRVAPSTFVALLPNVELADRVFNGGQSLYAPPLLHIRRWSRHFMASGGSALPRLLDVELLGLPIHLWEIRTAEQLLDEHCIILDLHDDTKDGGDLSVFKLRVWCADPGGLPSIIDLHVEESSVLEGDVPSSPRTVIYHVSIMVSHSDRSSMVPPTPPSPSFPGGRDDGRDRDSGSRQKRRFSCRPQSSSVRASVLSCLGPRVHSSRDNGGGRDSGSKQTRRCGFQHQSSSVRASVLSRLGPRDNSNSDFGGPIDALAFPVSPVDGLAAPVPAISSREADDASFLRPVGPVDASAPPTFSVSELAAPVSSKALIALDASSPASSSPVLPAAGDNYSPQLVVVPGDRCLGGSASTHFPRDLLSETASPSVVNQITTHLDQEDLQNATPSDLHSCNLGLVPSRTLWCMPPKVYSRRCRVLQQHPQVSLVDSQLVQSSENVSVDVSISPSDSPISDQLRSSFRCRVTKSTVHILPAPQTGRPGAANSTVVPPRRSRRIAGIGVENLATSSDGQTRFRKKVMRVLHVIDENEGINPEALDRYSKLFDKPLSPSHIQALAALFGWSAPEVGEC